MSTRKPWRVTPLLLGAFLAVGVGAGLPAAGRAGDGDGCGCSNRHCPGPYVHCMERPPCIKFKCSCPKPVCPPCDAEFWGYYPTCWRRWPAMFPNCPDRNPPWVAVAPPGVPAGFSNSLLVPRGEPMPGTPAPAAPPATPGASRPGYGEGVDTFPAPPASHQGPSPAALPTPRTNWSSSLTPSEPGPLMLAPAREAAVR
jgi:hypothetical protein